MIISVEMLSITHIEGKFNMFDFKFMSWSPKFINILFV